MLIIKPGFSSATFPAIIGLLGGMGAGAAYTCVRALSRKGEKSARIVFFFSMFSTLVCVPAMITDYHPMTWGQFFCLIGAGASAALGQFGVTLVRQRTGQRDFGVRLHAGHLLGCPRLFPVRPAAGRLERPRLSADLRHFGRGVLLQPQSGAQGTVI